MNKKSKKVTKGSKLLTLAENAYGTDFGGRKRLVPLIDEAMRKSRTKGILIGVPIGIVLFLAGFAFT